jgi:hypothetical protein
VVSPLATHATVFAAAPRVSRLAMAQQADTMAHGARHR